MSEDWQQHVPDWLRQEMEDLEEWEVQFPEEMRGYVRGVPFKESVEQRLAISINFAIENNLPDKEEHVFASFISNVRSALEIKEMMRDESLPKLPKFVEMQANGITKEEGREIVRKAITIIMRDLPGARIDELKAIWIRESQRGNVRENVNWVGGGDVLSEALGEDGKPFDPFSSV